MSKMTGFKYFSGTKQEFINKGLHTAHKDAIVFIKGGSDPKQSCIFAQEMYFANFSEFLAAINYVKGVKVGSAEYVATAGGGYIPFASGDNSTVALNVENGTITIGLTEAFVTKVNDTATNLGSSNDAADKEGSAFARIANLAELVKDLTGDDNNIESIAGQINSAINNLRTEIVGTLGTDDATTLAAINDELDTLNSNIQNKASTDENGKILAEHLPDFILGQVKFGGLATIMNATTIRVSGSTDFTNSFSGVTTISATEFETYDGIYFIVKNKGTTGAFASKIFEVGDWIISTGNAWEKVDNTDAVTSVAGLVGTVTADGLAEKLTATNSDKSKQLVSTQVLENTVSNLNSKINGITVNNKSFDSAGSSNITINTGDIDHNDTTLEELLDSLITKTDNTYTKTEIDTMLSWEELS